MKAQRIPWAGPLRVHRASNPQGISQTCKIFKKKQCGGTRGLWVSAPRPKVVSGEGPQITTHRPSQHELMTTKIKKKTMKAQNIPTAGPPRVQRASKPQGISPTCKI